MTAPNNKRLKLVAIKFQRLSDADESSLRKFINRELMQKNITIDEPDTEVKKQRAGFRVVFRDRTIRVVTEATQTIPQTQMDVTLVDISVGGCCLALTPEQIVVKNSTVYMTLDFCDPPISARGEILGLKRD